MNHHGSAIADRIFPGHIHRVVGGCFNWDELAAEDRTAAAATSAVTDASSHDVKSPNFESHSPHGRPESPPRLSPSLSSPRSSVLSTEQNVDPDSSLKRSATTVSAPSIVPRSLSGIERVRALMEAPTLDMAALKKVTWAGIPQSARPVAWRLLLEYMPGSSARRAETVARKRQSYLDAMAQHYSSSHMTSGDADDVTMRQISVDIPRTNPDLTLFQIPKIQAALQRVLYIWAMRHPASGYVQGMNDLVTPFFFVFLSEYAPAGTGMEMLRWTSLASLNNEADALANAEADSYWCLTALLNDIQDYYTFAQPGIQRRVQYLRDLVGRVDGPLKAHLDEEGLDFIQFAFRWMNCLLMREMPFSLIVRIWDTYLAEPDGFALFHVYVCAALLVWFSSDLQGMEFQDMVMFLQKLPTQDWTNKEIDIILSQAYMWRTIFGAAPSHLQRS